MIAKQSEMMEHDYPENSGMGMALVNSGGGVKRTPKGGRKRHHCVACRRYDVEENMHLILDPPDKFWLCDDCNEKNKPENL
jgi:hypothetical protein